MKKKTTERTRRSLRCAIVLAGALGATPCAMGEPPDPPLGRLFFTPEKRQRLDHQRDEIRSSPKEADTASLLSINGLVRSSGGRWTAWVSGKPIRGDAPDGDIAPLPNDPTRIRVQRTQTSPIALRVGASFDRVTGQITDVLDAGSITLNRTVDADR